jgi:DNA-binding beta-propeller fold protein YncE
VNPVTNKAFVITEDSRGPIAVLDANTLSTTFLLAGTARVPKAVAVNPVTNKAYALFSNELVVIDGATLATTSIPVADAGTALTAVATLGVNTATNRILVAAACLLLAGSALAQPVKMFIPPQPAAPLAAASSVVTNEIVVEFSAFAARIVELVGNPAVGVSGIPAVDNVAQQLSVGQMRKLFPGSDPALAAQRGQHVGEHTRGKVACKRAHDGKAASARRGSCERQAALDMNR